MAYAMTIVHHGEIIFLDVGYTAGEVLTKASSFVNTQFATSTNCNDVERFLDGHPDFAHLFKRTF